MILIFFPLYADGNGNYTALKKVVVVQSKKQEVKPTASLYRGIKISSEELRGLLEGQFTSYGIADQIPMAEKVITCENRKWVVDSLPHNGISFGAAQFTPDTWHDYGFGDIMNPQSQFIVMAQMWKAHLQLRWDCYRIVKNKIK